MERSEKTVGRDTLTREVVESPSDASVKESVGPELEIMDNVDKM